MCAAGDDKVDGSSTLTLTSLWDVPFGLPFFLTGPTYVSASRSLSDSVIGVDDTRGGFFGLFFGFARFCIDAIVASVSEAVMVLFELEVCDDFIRSISYGRTGLVRKHTLVVTLEELEELDVLCWAIFHDYKKSSKMKSAGGHLPLSKL